MGKQGEVVKERLEVTIIHELFHAIAGLPDLTPPIPSESALNGATFDHDGPTVINQNVVIDQMGWGVGQQQSSYLSGIPNTDPRFSTWRMDISHTEGATVDITYMGDRNAGAHRNDIQDTSTRTDSSRDLVFGFGGNDTIRTGAGNDYLYGGIGDDTLSPGSGNDLLHGGDRTTPVSQDGIDTADFSRTATTARGRRTASSSRSMLPRFPTPPRSTATSRSSSPTTATAAPTACCRSRRSRAPTRPTGSMSPRATSRSSRSPAAGWRSTATARRRQARPTAGKPMCSISRPPPAESLMSGRRPGPPRSRCLRISSRRPSGTCKSGTQWCRCSPCRGAVCTTGPACG